MDIELNGQKIDITLENEKNLQEVCSGLESWLRQSDMVITAIRINDEEAVSGVQENWGKRPLDGIIKIKLDASPLQEIFDEITTTARQYLTMFAEGMDEKNIKLLKELEPGFPYMLETIEHLIKRNPTPAWQQELRQWLQALKIKAVFDPDSPGAGEVPALCHQLLRMLEKLPRLRANTENSLPGLDQLRAELGQSLEKMNDVSIFLQTGKDKEAMEIIIRLTEQLQNLQSFLKRLKATGNFELDEQQIAGQSMEAFYTGLNGILKELISAFNIQDYVLIGDLMEYEIGPRLEEIKLFMDELVKHRPGNVRV